MEIGANRFGELDMKMASKILVQLANWRVVPKNIMQGCLLPQIQQSYELLSVRVDHSLRGG